MSTDEAVHIQVQVWRCMVLVEESVDMILGMILNSGEPWFRSRIATELPMRRFLRNDGFLAKQIAEKSWGHEVKWITDPLSFPILSHFDFPANYKEVLY